jgi:hypothetical protein
MGRYTAHVGHLEVIRGVVKATQVAKVNGKYQFSGVATSIGNTDRMGRVFLPGAFASLPPQVPLLAYHDDTRPIGISALKKQGDQVLHSSTLSNGPAAAELEELIHDGAVPATSIGWLSDQRYNGSGALERADPDFAEQCWAMGIEKAEDITYFGKGEILENSITPIPANPQALISVASLLGTDRGYIESMREVARESDPHFFFMSSDEVAPPGSDLGSTAYEPEAYSKGPGENVKCPQCQKYNEPDASFCDQCGLKLVGRDDVQTSVVEGMDISDRSLLDLVGGAATILADVMRIREDASIPDYVTRQQMMAESVAQLGDLAAVWSSAYVNNLPDSAFAYITPGGKADSSGKTTPRSLRHFPHHDDTGKPDEAHVRNALARIPQSNVPESAKASALAHIEKHAKAMGIDVSDKKAAAAQPDAPGNTDDDAPVNAGPMPTKPATAVKHLMTAKPSGHGMARADIPDNPVKAHNAMHGEDGSKEKDGHVHSKAPAASDIDPDLVLSELEALTQRGPVGNQPSVWSEVLAAEPRFKNVRSGVQPEWGLVDLG